MRTRIPITAADVLWALKRSEGDVEAAAKSLGVSPRTLYRRMREFGIRGRVSYEPAAGEAA